MNNINLVGRLTRDVELRNSQGNTTYATFSIAIKDSYSKDVDFFDCVAFGKTAEYLAKYTSKGERVAVNGSMHCTIAEETGVKYWKVKVMNAEALGSKKSEDKEDAPKPFKGMQVVEDGEELPF